MFPLDGISKALSEQGQVIRDIYRNPEIAPDEKRQLIDTLYYREIELAHIPNESLQQTRAALGAAP